MGLAPHPNKVLTLTTDTPADVIVGEVRSVRARINSALPKNPTKFSPDARQAPPASLLAALNTEN